VDVSGKIKNGDTQATLEFSSSKDYFIPVMLAFVTDYNTDFRLFSKAYYKNPLFKGDIITYINEALNSENVVASDVVFTNDIPAKTLYQDGSITLNGKSLTDEKDDDEGEFDKEKNQVIVRISRQMSKDDKNIIKFDVKADGNGTIRSQSSLTYKVDKLNKTITLLSDANKSKIGAQENFVFVKSDKINKDINSSKGTNSIEDINSSDVIIGFDTKEDENIITTKQNEYIVKISYDIANLTYSEYNKTTNEQTNNYELYLGRFYNDNVLLTGRFNYTYLNDSDIKSLGLGCEYFLKPIKQRLNNYYLGANIEYANFSDPDSKKDSGVIYGFNSGWLYNLKKGLYLDASFQYKMLNSLQSKNYDLNSMYLIGIGLRY